MDISISTNIKIRNFMYINTYQLELWNNTQPTLLINNGKLLKKSSIRKKENEKLSLRNILNTIFIFS